jgi:hypothetical protein
MLQSSASTLGWVHYLPMITTVLAAVFCVQLFRRFRLPRSGAHLLWWGIGVFAYGLGTALESAITLFGNSVFLNKSWYIAGALLGAYPLAQGTVCLLLKRHTARILTAITLPLVATLCVLVVWSPVVIEAMESHRPSGAILGWQWIRGMTPIVNLYAVFFLIGGAMVSSVRYQAARGPGDGSRAAGNSLIAFGALLPAIGGGMAKAGVVEALYVGELIGLVFIWLGYMACVRSPTASAGPDQQHAIAEDDRS